MRRFRYWLAMVVCDALDRGVRWLDRVIAGRGRL
jgi:hypothetical protein